MAGLCRKRGTNKMLWLALRSTSKLTCFLPALAGRCSRGARVVQRADDGAGAVRRGGAGPGALARAHAAQPAAPAGKLTVWFAVLIWFSLVRVWFSHLQLARVETQFVGGASPELPCCNVLQHSRSPALQPTLRLCAVVAQSCLTTPALSCTAPILRGVIDLTPRYGILHDSIRLQDVIPSELQFILLSVFLFHPAVARRDPMRA